MAMLVFAAAGAAKANAQQQPGVPQPAKAEELFALTNETRAQEGQDRLMWDQALADAALKHCLRMAAEGPISHRYGGEPDLTARAGEAGAHFSLIEENIAVGSYPARIHQTWLNSPGHRANLLNPQIDHVGIAVVSAQGMLYAVADYVRAVPVRSPAQVEAEIAAQIRSAGIAISRDASQARAACAMDHGLPAGAPPAFVMRWQDSDLSHLPGALAERLRSGQFHSAEVGSCPPRNADGAFTIYRVAVLLY